MRFSFDGIINETFPVFLMARSIENRQIGVHFKRIAVDSERVVTLAAIVLHHNAQPLFNRLLHGLERGLRTVEIDVAAAAHQRIRIESRHRLAFHNDIAEIPTVQKTCKLRDFGVHLAVFLLVQPLNGANFERQIFANRQLILDDGIRHQSAHALLSCDFQNFFDFLGRNRASQRFLPQFASNERKDFLKTLFSIQFFRF